MQEKHTLVPGGHDVKVANKIFAEKLRVMEHKRALLCVWLLYAEEYPNFLLL